MIIGDKCLDQASYAFIHLVFPIKDMKPFSQVLVFSSHLPSLSMFHNYIAGWVLTRNFMSLNLGADIAFPHFSVLSVLL